MIRIGAYSVCCDFLMAADQYTIGAVSYYDRSLSLIKAMGGMLSNQNENLHLETEQSMNTFILKGNEFETIIQPIVSGKEKFYHAISINKSMNKDMILFRKGHEGEQFYNYLMKEFDLPLLQEWGTALFECAHMQEVFRYNEFQGIYRGKNSRTESLDVSKDQVPISDLYLSGITLDTIQLEDMVRELFKRGKIRITEKKQDPLEFQNLDEYITKYGTTLVKNLSDTIVPLRELDGIVEDFTLKSMRLFPQQAAQINGAVALLEKCSNYAILNNDMGTGKTIVSASVIESYFVRKWLRKNDGKTYRDAYLDRENVTYRNVVMCPGHLVEKWASEMNKQIPYAKVTIIREFSQLLELRKLGASRKAKEWFIMSKDFSKLSYQLEPSPKKQRFGYMYEKVCEDCQETYHTEGHTCPKCGSRKYSLKQTSYAATGMVCPHCNKILMPYRNANVDAYSDNPTEPLSHMDFAKKTTMNSKCYYCESELWQPHVSLIGESAKSIKWIRATHYANKTHKNTITVWVHRDYCSEYFESIGEQPLRMNDTDVATGSRKYSPAEYIRKYLKGYFDFAIFDEVHELKGGGTGQGMAMHALVKASKKQLALTGTIAGGYATNLFYLLYRLEPQRMKDKGFLYTDELKFAEKYGKIEKEYAYTGDVEVYNTSCKGKQLGQAKMKPGISPLIYMDFLLDRATNLNLSDMSKYLPVLKEYVIPVNADSEVSDEYRRVIETLNEASREKGNGGRALLSSMLQFSLSYLDKPFGIEPIKSPMTGAIVTSPESFDEYMDIEEYEELLPKEKELVRIVQKEIAEHRNCFVYAEYTASPITCVSYRLKEVLEKHCNLAGKVAILESESPKASMREAWIKDRAAEGVKVFITNPRCVATGLDFSFMHKGKQFNYPTIIFYQMGYNMFLVSQASRRHYRLNQTRECRTYYMCYARTAQQTAISLIADKQVSTAAIQGKFSVEGLASMANGVDTRLKLAQSLSESDTQTVNELQEMFDVIANNTDDGEMYTKYKPMVLFKDLVGEDIAKEENGETDIIDLWSMFNISMNTEQVASDLDEEAFYEPTMATKKPRAVKNLFGQLSLF